MIYTSRFFHFVTSGLLLLLIAFAISGCASTPLNIVGGCELPPALDQHDSLTDLPTDHDLTPEEQKALWAKDRAHLSKSVKHGNDTVDYVHGHCQ
jgi:starvation-inducible outer membrane lipoprotein